ncbi:hypothetical protein I6L58_20135 [Enterobacter cancerogenus]|uniref:Uncharacterized protein n=1 Tax=Enterobacter cancerogenus TaxID=69218 RepID=A0ABX8KJQ9_9ENTR|nr:hypothetical protein [Enterobacter cancerogenus]QXA48972.1 hypothetical protein I6L58_20135 [Enterobacter cancerogenus]
MNKLLSLELQKDILDALLVFHPHRMTADQYFECFGDCDEFQMLANVDALIGQGLIDDTAIHVCDGEKFISLGQLKLSKIALQKARTT